MKYIELNQDNSILAIYDDANKNVPPGAIAITNQEFETMRADADGFGFYDWDSANGVIVKNTTRFDAENLAKSKRAKRLELRGTMQAKINAIIPGDDEISEAALWVLEQFWLSINGTSKNATPELTSIISVIQAFKTARNDINALTTVAEVEAYDVINTPVWPL